MDYARCANPPYIFSTNSQERLNMGLSFSGYTVTNPKVEVYMLDLDGLKLKTNNFYYNHPINQVINEDSLRKKFKHELEFKAYSNSLIKLNAFIFSFHTVKSDFLDTFNDFNVYMLLHNEAWKKESADLLKSLSDYTDQLRLIDANSILYTSMRESLINSIELTKILATTDQNQAQYIEANKAKIVALTDTINKTSAFVQNTQDSKARKDLFDTAQNLLNIAVDPKKLKTFQDRLYEGIAFSACLMVCAALFSSPIIFAAACSAPLLVVVLGAALALFFTAEAAVMLVEKGHFFNATPKLDAIENGVVNAVDSFTDVCSPVKRGFFSGKKQLVESAKPKTPVAPSPSFAA